MWSMIMAENGKKGKHHCCVPKCHSNRSHNNQTLNISFHHFPKESEDKRRQQWLVRIRRANFKITPNTVVCSLHFRPEDFKWTPVRKILKKDAVPSVFSWTIHSASKPSTTVTASGGYCRSVVDLPRSIVHVKQKADVAEDPLWRMKGKGKAETLSTIPFKPYRHHSEMAAAAESTDNTSGREWHSPVHQSQVKLERDTKAEPGFCPNDRQFDDSQTDTNVNQLSTTELSTQVSGGLSGAKVVTSGAKWVNHDRTVSVKSEAREFENKDDLEPGTSTFQSPTESVNDETFIHEGIKAEAQNLENSVRGDPNSDFYQEFCSVRHANGQMVCDIKFEPMDHNDVDALNPGASSTRSNEECSENRWVNRNTAV